MYTVPNMQVVLSVSVQESDPNSESHLHAVFICKAVERQHVSLGLSHHRDAAVQAGIVSTQSIMCQYLGGDRATRMVLLD